MKCVVYRGSGGVEVVAIEERPLPEISSEQVLVRVAAAGLNRADVIQRRGAYPAPPGWPADVPGLEYAGTIERVGSAASGWAVGDRVMGLVGGGAQAEYLAVHHEELMAVPEHVDLVAGAAIPEAFLTAYDALVIRARLRGGERVLLHAVGSGVSTAAVQLVKWLGGVAVGTSRTPAKLARAKTLGLDEGIDTSGCGFREQLAGPVDVILDYFGGPALADNVACLRVGGRLVLLGTLQGSLADAVDVGRVLRHRVEIIGTVMRARAHDERVMLVRQFGSLVLPAFRRGGPLGPVVGESYSMTEVAAAHQAMEANRTFGKIVLCW